MAVSFIIFIIHFDLVCPVSLYLTGCFNIPFIFIQIFHILFPFCFIELPAFIITPFFLFNNTVSLVSLSCSRVSYYLSFCFIIPFFIFHLPFNMSCTSFQNAFHFVLYHLLSLFYYLPFLFLSSCFIRPSLLLYIYFRLVSYYLSSYFIICFFLFCMTFLLFHYTSHLISTFHLENIFLVSHYLLSCFRVPFNLFHHSFRLVLYFFPFCFILSSLLLYTTFPVVHSTFNLA